MTSRIPKIPRDDITKTMYDNYYHKMQEDCELIPFDKMEVLLEHAREFKKIRDSILELDTDFQQYLDQTKNTNQIIPRKDFQNKLNNISPDSLIMYVKKAQIYKVYNVENLSDFEHDEGTHYRRQQYGPVYEVVRDTHPQKLMIVVQDDIQGEQLQNVKSHITEFIGKDPSLSKTQLSDLRVYSNDNNTEFVVSSLRLKNMQEKELFIESFIRFMQQKGETVLANQIQVRYPPCELIGARYYELPSSKISLDNNSTAIISQLITTPTNTPFIVNATFINYNNSTTINNSTININTSDQSGIKTLKSFYRYLYDTKPSWYIEDKYVDMKIIGNAYRDYFNDHETHITAISKQLRQAMFSNSRRTSGTTQKKLVTYNALKKYF